MKFSVSSGELLSRLQVVGRALNAKNTLPIMTNFLFVVEGDTLTITASDQEVTITSSLHINNEDTNGRFALADGKLTEYLKRLPEQPVTISVNDENYAISISTMLGNNNQVGCSAADYPEMAKLNPDEVRTLNINSGTLLTTIAKVLFATSNDELRPIMGGILFDITPEYTTFVATDSHKLARYTRADVKSDTEASFILNKRPAALLKNMLGKDDDVKIEFDYKNAIFTMPNYVMICRLLEGKYPNYKSVIPSANPYRVIINRTDMLNAINRVSLFADTSSLVRLDITASATHVLAEDLDFSCSASEEIPCQYNGNDMSIGFKSDFLSDILSNMSCEEIMIDLSDPSRAGLIMPSEKSENEDELMLIMPMKI